jgi:hypothetical protein
MTISKTDRDFFYNEWLPALLKADMGANALLKHAKTGAGDPHDDSGEDPHANEPLDPGNEREARAATADDEAARNSPRDCRHVAMATRQSKSQDTDDMDKELSQHIPAGTVGDNGRLATAKAIRQIHKSACGDIIKSHFSARPAPSVDIDLSKLVLTSGNRLRKSDSDIVRKLAAAGITIKPATGNDSVAAFKSVKSALSAPQLPSQNSNGVWGDAPAGRAGAVSAESVNSADPGRRVPTPGAPLVGPSQSASIRVGRPPPQDQDVTTKAIAAIHAAGPIKLWGR